MKSKLCPFCKDLIQKLPQPHQASPTSSIIYESCYSCGFSPQREGLTLRAAVLVVEQKQLAAQWKSNRLAFRASLKFISDMEELLRLRQLLRI